MRKNNFQARGFLDARRIEVIVNGVHCCTKSGSMCAGRRGILFEIVLFDFVSSRIFGLEIPGITAHRLQIP